MEKKVNWKEKIKDPKFKAYVFFGFYAVFFLVLIIMIRTSPARNEVNSTPSPSPSNTPVEENTHIKNYQYIYTITEDEKSLVYMGKAYDHKELFTFVDKVSNTYYRLNDHFFKEVEGDFVVDSNPYLYEAFYNLDTLEELIEHKDPIQEDNEDTYTVPVSDILDIYYPEENYNGFIVDEIEDAKIIVNKTDDKIAKVTFQLDPLATYLNQVGEASINHLTITLEYYDYGKITDFDME